MQTLDKTVKQLGQFGMSDKGAKLYLALLELGPSTVQEVAKHVKMNRSTAHILCEKLRKKGFIGQTRKGSKRLIFAEDKEKFQKIVQDEQFGLDLKKMTLEGLLPALENIQPGDKDSPRVRFYEGEQGFIDICQRSLDKAEKEILFISSMHGFYDVTTAAYDQDHYIPERIKRGLRIKVIAFDDKYTRAFQKNDKEKMRETRLLPPDFPFRSTMFIYQNELSIISSMAPFLGVVIESAELAQFMRQIFNTLWKFVAKK